tara:strand:+ start:17487 stop:17669 length:183 start_codon:yes stop_codon:yes gene_type:complete
MASIIDKYKNSEFAKLGKSTKDKTPYSADSGNKLHQDEKALAQARGGKLKGGNYSSTVSY